MDYDTIISGPPMINGVNNFDAWISSWTESGKAKVKELRPDIVIDDMVARCGSLAAEDLGIPSIINAPAGPISFM